MKKSIIILVLCVLPVTVSAATRSQPLTIALSRFSLDRVAAARSYYERRMYQVKRTTAGAIGAVVLAFGAKYGLSFWREYNPSEEEMARRSDEKKAHDLVCDAISEKNHEGAAHYAAALKEIRKYGELKGGIPARSKKQADQGIAAQVLRNAVTLGIAGLILTSGQQVFRICSGTIEEALYIWFKGYEHWYVQMVDQLRAIMNELRENFYQARKVAQQSHTEQQLLLARQQRRTTPLAYEISTHYRLDIVTMYQKLVSIFERVVALMFIMAPTEHHVVMEQHVATISAKLDAVSQSLELDLNENTHGMLTLYSNATLDGYHECIEAIGIFLSTYSTYLRR